MLESLLQPEGAERAPWKMLFLAMALGAISMALAAIIGQGVETGHLFVAFTCIGAAPLMVRLIQLEEEHDEDKSVHGEIGILVRHSGMIEAYAFYFLGIIVISSLFFVVFPSDVMNSVLSSQLGELGAIEGLRTTGRAVSACGFMCLLENNIGVLVLVLVFSFVFGAGAVYINTWNASIVGTLIGTIAKQQAAASGGSVILAYLVALPYALISIFPHGIFEIGSYFVGGLAGGMLGAAMIRRDWKDPVVLKDIVTMFLIAVLFVVVGAAIESAAL